MLIPYFLGRDFLNAVLINISCPIHHENTRLESKKCFLVLVDTFNCISLNCAREIKIRLLHSQDLHDLIVKMTIALARSS
jgi:hypothetical protein